MEGLRNLRALCLVILSISIFCLSEARHHSHNKPYAIIVGAVFCETCFQDDMSNSKGSHYISGATVAVECAQGATRPAFYQEIKTNKQGKFKVELPFSISKHVKKIEGCTVKLVKSSEPYCAVASTATSSLIHLKDKKGGKHIFSAGFFTFKPLKQPGLCNQQPSVTNSQLNSINPSKLIDQNIPLMPSVHEKRVKGYKYKKVDNANGLVRQSKQSIFPPFFPPLVPNPLQPPPAPLIPNPFQPPPTPLIPNPFQPPSPPPTLLPPLPNLPNLPPVPGLTPPPPPPPPPTLPLIPPGIPILPPLIPGVPPLKAKKVNP